MLRAETELRVGLKVGQEGLGINDLVAEVFERKDEICGQIVSGIVWQVQEAWLEEVLTGTADVACRRCGVVEGGPGAVLRRGRRRRRVRTSVGRLELSLRQVTCRWCRKTWCPFAERLGLRPRQRVLEELMRRLVDWATELSYAKSSRLGEECLGATASPRRIHQEVQERGEDVEFTEHTEHGPVETLVADGTKVPAGGKERGEDVSLAFQIRGRRLENRRPVVDKRVVGFGIGWGHWQETLATTHEPELLVTDGETGVAELAEWYFPGTRHQRCEWHLSYGLGHALGKDGLSVEERDPGPWWSEGSEAVPDLHRRARGLLARPYAPHECRALHPLLSTLLGAHDQRHGARDARGQPTNRRGRPLEHPRHLQPPQAPAGETTQP